MTNHFDVFRKIREITPRSPATFEGKKPEIGEHDIPIMIDDVKKLKNFSMTRFSYFVIECDQPSLDWCLELEEKTIPFYLLSLSGVIARPMGNNLLFDSPVLIDELFDQIEAHPALYVDTNDLWLPNILLKGPQKRGHVYRVGIELFNQAFRYKEAQITDERFLSYCEEATRYIKYSKEETEAFRAWEEEQIRKAVDIYPKSPAQALKWSS